MAPTNAAGAAPANAGGVAGSSKPLFGGNVGRKPRSDGLKPGSPEAIAADRAKNAERMRRARAEKAAATPPPPLPAAGAPGVAAPQSVSGQAQNPGDPLGLPPGVDGVSPLADWTAEDFNGAAPEVIELIEAWCIESDTALAAEGGLPEKVVRKIAADAAFPKSSKESLRRTSPAMLAKFANAVKLPGTLKPYIAGLPSVAVIVIGRLKNRAEIRKLIEEDRKLRAEASKPQTASPSP
jgi:hypothetical protein